MRAVAGALKAAPDGARHQPALGRLAGLESGGEVDELEDGSDWPCNGGAAAIGCGPIDVKL
jgi:hypothetical protein